MSDTVSGEPLVLLILLNINCLFLAWNKTEISEQTNRKSEDKNCIQPCVKGYSTQTDKRYHEKRVCIVLSVFEVAKSVLFTQICGVMVS